MSTFILLIKHFTIHCNDWNEASEVNKKIQLRKPTRNGLYYHSTRWSATSQGVSRYSLCFVLFCLENPLHKKVNYIARNPDMYNEYVATQVHSIISFTAISNKNNI